MKSYFLRNALIKKGSLSTGDSINNQSIIFIIKTICSAIQQTQYKTNVGNNKILWKHLLYSIACVTHPFIKTIKSLVCRQKTRTTAFLF